MTWQRKPVAAAIASILDELDQGVGVFATPPETLNPPAYVCGYPRTVDFDQAQFGVDVCQFQLMALVAPNDVDRLDELLALAKEALKAETTLGGTVIHARPTVQSNWHPLDIAGAKTLAGELTLEIKM